MSDALAQASVAAARWSLVGSALKFMLQLAVNIAMARLLGPDQYGLFALAGLVLLAVTMLTEVGLSWSLMQRQHIDDSIVRFVFTFQGIGGLCGLAVLVCGAPWLALWLGDPRLEPLIRLLGLSCLLSALGTTAINLLRRDLRFKTLTQLQTGAYVLAFGGLGLPLAWAGYGAWSLAIAWTAQAGLILLLAAWARPHAWRPLWQIESASQHLRTGITVLLTNLCNWLLTNADRLLVGRLLGAQSAGWYAVGYNLASVPNGLLVSSLQPAFLATGARLQQDPARLGRAYLEVQAFVWTLVAPIFFVGAVCADGLIALLYGPAWAPSAGVLAWLMLGMPAALAFALSTPLLWSTGRGGWESALQLPLIPLAVLAFVWAAGQGLVHVAATAAALFVLRALLIGTAALRRVGAVPGMRKAVVHALAFNAWVLLAALLAGCLLQGGDPLAKLLAQSAAAAAAALAVLALRPGWLGAAALRPLGRLLPQRLQWGRLRAAVAPSADGSA